MKLLIDGEVIDTDTILKISQPAESFYSYNNLAPSILEVSFTIYFISKTELKIRRGVKGAKKAIEIPDHWLGVYPRDKGFDEIPEELKDEFFNRKEKAYNSVNSMYQALLLRWTGQSKFEDLTVE